MGKYDEASNQVGKVCSSVFEHVSNDTAVAISILIDATLSTLNSQDEIIDERNGRVWPADVVGRREARGTPGRAQIETRNFFSCFQIVSEEHSLHLN